MTDYGHDLQFGIFPTPDAAAADLVLEMSEAADVSGLDLVTLQDHPYQARHLDAWTLLSVIGGPHHLGAARAQRRQPAAAATGRPGPQRRHPRPAHAVAGSSSGWAPAPSGTPSSPPAARAGPRASRSRRSARPSRSSAASGPARGSVRVEGDHYTVRGLHAGPTPAHPVEIWLGAYKPRLLRLTGRVADGWLPSMGYAAPEALPRDEPHHRRGGRVARARPRRHPPALQRRG